VTDETIRQLQRRFEQSGSEADELAWLQGRVRVGETLAWERHSRQADWSNRVPKPLLGICRSGKAQRDSV